MSISATGGTTAVPTQPTTTNSASTSASSANSSSASATQITKTVTETHADGSITTITTYADGSTTTRTTPPPANKAGPAGAPGPGRLGGLLDSRNAGQGNTLLAAQAQATTGG